MPARPWRSDASAVDDVHDGLAYVVEQPGAAAGGVVVLHGAGSSRDSHEDFAACCLDASLAVLRFDMRGHGRSEGRLDGRAIADVASMCALLRATAGTDRIGLRGSSMGGYLALAAAAEAGAAAVVAICPASGDGLRRGLAEQRYAFAADAAGLGGLLADVDETAAARALGPRLQLVHAEGDEVVPVARSRALHAAAPGSELVVAPGGHHRSAQHDPDLQRATVRFLRDRLRAPA
jgi:pimeloyl-ACP methyl ester carboxylesterase